MAHKTPHIFSLPNLQILLARHLEKFLFIIFLFIITTYIIYIDNLRFLGLILALFNLSVIMFVFIIIKKKFAYKIVINFDLKKIQFYMFRRKDIIIKDFNKIQKIRVNGYLIFVFFEEKIYYSEFNNYNLLKCIHSIKKIEWGRLCSIWGPSRKIREKIASQNS
mgnify:CR=1 FL=1